MANAPPRLGTGCLTPTTLVNDRYRIINKIAQGGMGAVYLVKDMRLSDPNLGRDKFCALKEMSQSAFTPDQLADAIKMFGGEARMLAHLRHPNLPEVTDCFEFQSNQYLVMDYIKGETFEAILKRNNGPLKLPDVLKWANQLFGVFQYLHDQNPPIIYRDLKPSNIMLERDTGLLKIIDFGIARFLRKRTSKNLRPQNVAVDDAGIGTPGYAAPEQWKKGELLYPQSDIYSLGVVLHQLLTNYDPTTIPFSLPSIQSLSPSVPPKIADAIAKGYALKLAERYQTIKDFQNAFQQAWLESFGGWNVPGNKPTT
jgi:serine/threonine-protein kinase